MRLYGCLPQALECQAGFTDSNNGQDVTITQRQWQDFLGTFRDRLKLLRLIANVSRPAGLSCLPLIYLTVRLHCAACAV
jgi:hypothetical protein